VQDATLKYVDRCWRNVDRNSPGFTCSDAFAVSISGISKNSDKNVRRGPALMPAPLEVIYGVAAMVTSKETQATQFASFSPPQSFFWRRETSATQSEANSLGWWSRVLENSVRGV